MAKNKTASTLQFPHESFFEQGKIDLRRRGDQTNIQVFTSVGEALSAWEQLEEGLETFFVTLCADSQNLSSYSHQVFHHLFGIVESSSARLNAIQALAALHFGHDWEHDLVRLPYMNLIKAIRKASHRRNEIAHGRVTRVQKQMPDKPSQDNGWFLTSPPYAVNRNQPFYGGSWNPEDVLGGIDQSKYRYTASDIVVFAQKFRALRTETIKLSGDASIGEHRLPKIVERLYREGKI